ncbi:MAG: TolC family protein [Bacteroidales bacterium]|nr:TolC family protein [Bacteroidales bacterium]
MEKAGNYIIWILISILSTLAGNAQDSLYYYLEEAAINNPEVKASFLEYSAALEKVPQASSLPDPELQLGYFIKPMELLGGSQVADIRLMQMFPWFGTLKAAKDESSKMALAKFEGFRETKNRLYFNVKASYFKIYRTQKEIEIAEQNLEILHTLENIALIKFRSGGTSGIPGKVSKMQSAGSTTPTGQNSMGGNDMLNQGSMAAGAQSSIGNNSQMSVTNGGMGKTMEGNGKDAMVNLLRVQIEIHELENRISLLTDQLITDKVSFNQLLNREPSSEVFTKESLNETAVPADILSLSDSLVNHPMVKMYEAESEANSAKLRMVSRMSYPMLGLGLNYSVIQKREGNASAMNGNDMIMPMASVSLPIYRKKYNAMRREAEYLRDASGYSAENVKNYLVVEFRQSLQNLYDADRKVILYSDQVNLADKSVQLLIASFSANGSNFEEVLRMQQQLLDYQFKQVEAVVDKNTSLARLVYLTGNN